MRGYPSHRVFRQKPFFIVAAFAPTPTIPAEWPPYLFCPPQFPRPDLPAAKPIPWAIPAPAQRPELQSRCRRLHLHQIPLGPGLESAANRLNSNRPFPADSRLPIHAVCRCFWPHGPWPGPRFLRSKATLGPNGHKVLSSLDLSNCCRHTGSNRNAWGRSGSCRLLAGTARTGIPKPEDDRPLWRSRKQSKRPKIRGF